MTKYRLKTLWVGFGEGACPSPEKENANNYDIANKCPTNIYNMTNVGEL